MEVPNGNGFWLGFSPVRAYSSIHSFPGHVNRTVRSPYTPLLSPSGGRFALIQRNGSQDLVWQGLAQPGSPLNASKPSVNPVAEPQARPPTPSLPSLSLSQTMQGITKTKLNQQKSKLRNKERQSFSDFQNKFLFVLILDLKQLCDSKISFL